jgi:hypothetical protein
MQETVRNSEVSSRNPGLYRLPKADDRVRFEMYLLPAYMADSADVYIHT